MAGVHGTSSSQQIYASIYSRNMGSESAGAPASGASSKTGAESSVKESAAQKVETKGWSPLDQNSSLIPRTTEYGNTIGDVKLSDTAKDYYDKLKAKFNNMDFIVVSKDMKGLAQQNAASYGNAKKMVVLVDEEKLERMATDESFRNKYEGIIASASLKMTEAKNSLTASGASVKNFGMSVDADGKESFFATVEKSGELQKKRIEKKAAEKKLEKAKEKKKAEKEAREERIRKAREKKAEQEERLKKGDKTEKEEKADQEPEEISEVDDREYVTIEADSMEELLSKVQSYSYDGASSRVMTDSERMVGSHIDFRG